MKMQSTRHSKYNIHYHLVWIPKYRKEVLTKKIAKKIENIFREIAENKRIGVERLEIMPDHVHLFVSAPPQYSPSLLVNWFKGISARVYNYRYKKPYIKWTNAYYVGTAGTVTTETIKRYIEEQKMKKDEN